MTAKILQLLEQECMVKTARKAVVIFTEGYYYKPPWRGQFTACPKHYINSFMIFHQKKEPDFLPSANPTNSYFPLQILLEGLRLPAEVVPLEGCRSSFPTAPPREHTQT